MLQPESQRVFASKICMLAASVHNDDNNNDDFIIFYCKFLASVSSNFMPVNISLCFRLLVLRMDKNNVTRLLRHLMSSNRAQSMNPEMAAGSCIRSDQCGQVKVDVWWLYQRSDDSLVSDASRFNFKLVVLEFLHKNRRRPSWMDQHTESMQCSM